MRLPFNASVVNVAASGSVVGERVPCHPAVQLTEAQSGKIHFSPACFGFTRHNTAVGQWPRPSAPSRTRGRRCITRTGYSAQNTRIGGECAAFWRPGDGAKRAYSTLQAAEQSWQMNFSLKAIRSRSRVVPYADDNRYPVDRSPVVEQDMLANFC